jgi:tRNA(Arg) A34 adenosine deaminase TadA
VAERPFTDQAIQPPADLPTDWSAADLSAMRLALQQAELARNNGEVPVGAVVLDASGEVIG